MKTRDCGDCTTYQGRYPAAMVTRVEYTVDNDPTVDDWGLPSAPNIR